MGQKELYEVFSGISGRLEDIQRVPEALQGCFWGFYRCAAWGTEVSSDISGSFRGLLRVFRRSYRGVIGDSGGSQLWYRASNGVPGCLGEFPEVSEVVDNYQEVPDTLQGRGFQWLSGAFHRVQGDFNGFSVIFQEFSEYFYRVSDALQGRCWRFQMVLGGIQAFSRA